MSKFDSRFTSKFGGRHSGPYSGNTSGEGVGGVVTYPIDTPSIAVVSPVTNPPGFDIGLPEGNVTTSRNVAVGDIVQLQFDGAGTIYESSALTSGDIIAGTITITGVPTLSAGNHTGQTRIRRPGTPDIFSSWAVSASFAITIPVPVNSVAPVVSGATAAGSLLSCTTGSWSNTPTAYAYQWKADGTNIGGATSATYTSQTGDIGKSITCAVTASNAGGAGSPATSNGITVVAAERDWTVPGSYVISRNTRQFAVPGRYIVEVTA